MPFAQIVVLRTLVANNFLTFILRQSILLLNMNYTKKDIVIGFVIIAVIILGTLLFKKYTNSRKAVVTSTPVSISFKDELEKNFRYTIPENTNSIELKDVSGGDGRGIATDNEVLADIPDPKYGYFYQGWLEKGNELISLGKLQSDKGGWLLEYNKSKLDDADKITVSLEINFDTQMETKVLEGSFK